MTYVLVDNVLTALDGLDKLDFGPKLSDVWAEIVEGFDPSPPEPPTEPITDIERAWGSWDNPTTVDTDLIV